ncbi:hypothetical protein CEXT_138491 [Caerostris extrusa]|uniref:Uncharacterized protein n=1 Tax=Caerostris extrusa TaxID=172846 RepID=A0AAV4VPB3_CAEEX|nr:hypothetical protein CEXT_138491 [Caerostris extrusa]
MRKTRIMDPPGSGSTPGWDLGGQGHLHNTPTKTAALFKSIASLNSPLLQGLVEKGFLKSRILFPLYPWPCSREAPSVAYKFDT